MSAPRPAPSADWEREVVVVGAGAAGLWAAAVAARAGRGVLLLEKTRRTGTKILASGGTRCNLTTTLGAAEAARLFRRRGERFLGPAFGALSPADLRERFGSLGLPTVEAPLEKVFPASGRARDVRDALEREARAAGVEIVLDAPGRGVRRDGSGWGVAVGGGRSAVGGALLLCTGGASYPRTGTTGEGYAWLRELGLPVVEPTPALVPLTSPEAWVRELTGIALEDVEVRAVDGRGRTVAVRRRPLLFTHQGISGPGPMDVSVHVGRGGVSLVRVDLLPDVEREELRRTWIEAARAPGRPRLAKLLPEIPRRVVEAAARRAGAGEGNPVLAGLSRERRHALIETLKGLPIEVDGTRGWELAEVTAGGLDVRAVNPRTMEVNGMRGLYVLGELLDLDGPIGGLSFQAAFACAELAGRAVSV